MTEIGKVWQKPKFIRFTLHRPNDSLHFLCLCLLSPLLFPLPLSPELQTSLIFYISAYHLFTLLWHLQCSPPVSLSPQVPVALTDSLQSVANRTRVSLAPTHKQHAAHPPHQPTSIPMIANTQCRGRMFALVSVLGLKSLFVFVEYCV